MNVKELVSNTTTLLYKDLCTTLIQKFGVKQPVNWESVLPHQQQQGLFGGEILRLIADHPTLATQKEIKPVCLMKGEISQLLFFFVQLKDEKLPKTVIEKITRKFVGGAAADRYVIWFFGNKNANVLKIVVSGKEGKKIRLKTLTLEAGQWFKTYDYILGEVERKFNTEGLFQSFKEPSGLWKAVWEAFDISIVNKKFYAEIKAVFDALIKEELAKCKGILTNNEDKVQFAIRLIGRIIFCWFLKRKGIIADNVLSTIAVKGYPNYYRYLLEPLFFDVFNTPLKKRKKDLPAVVKDYPFLNGGLFEPQHHDHKGNWALVISNEWFINLFGNTLERYNFTVDENTSASSEIAIDPEMLGRIFENLLAEQNPETGESARKSTGSYYTPREIVDFMVEESLIAYLKTRLASEVPSPLWGEGQGEGPIEDFVRTGILPDPLKPYSADLLKLLNSIKVLDPASGSGAFPVSMLQKIVELKHQLDPHSLIYDLKLKTIENSTYGVDIQPMATELSRLRCWLSLIVDEDPKDIRPLPNLDFKFVTANSLIDLGYDEFIQKAQGKKGGGLLLISNFLNLLDRLKEVRQKYFESIDQKERLKKEFNVIKNDLFNMSLELIKQKHLDTEFSNKITGWDPFDDSNPAPFFNKSWMFGVEDGFDIVIANPPYHQLSKDPSAKRDYKDYLKARFRTSGGRLNTFIFFLHEGIELLLNKGNLVYIIPNTFLTQEYYKATRKLLIDTTNISQIVHYPTMQFENAIVENITIQLIKDGRSEKTKFLIQNSDKISLQTENSIRLKSLPPNYSFNITENSILEKIEKTKHVTLNDLCEINQAIALKGDKSLSLRDNNSKGKFFKLLDGRNINRYSIKWDGVYLDYNLDRIHSCKRRDIFETNEKLLFRRVSSTLIFAYDTEKYYALNTLVVVNKKHTSTDLKFLIGILNSKLINYYYREKYKSTKTVFSEIQARSVGNLPIINIDSSLQKPFNTRVDQILSAKQKDPNADTSALEHQIDKMVYELYGLTPEEIKIVEGNKEVYR